MYIYNFLYVYTCVYNFSQCSNSASLVYIVYTNKIVYFNYTFFMPQQLKIHFKIRIYLAITPMYFSTVGLCQFKPNSFAATVKPISLGETGSADCIYTYMHVFIVCTCTCIYMQLCIYMYMYKCYV